MGTRTKPEPMALLSLEERKPRQHVATPFGGPGAEALTIEAWSYRSTRKDRGALMRDIHVNLHYQGRHLGQYVIRVAEGYPVRWRQP